MDPILETQEKQPPQPSYVKLAMRNMVRKKGTSLKHFFFDHSDAFGFFGGYILFDALIISNVYTLGI